MTWTRDKVLEVFGECLDSANEIVTSSTKKNELFCTTCYTDKKEVYNEQVLLALRMLEILLRAEIRW